MVVIYWIEKNLKKIFLTNKNKGYIKGMNLGYCCVNMKLSYRKTMVRTMIELQ